jgi:hypothetical protein
MKGILGAAAVIGLAVASGELRFPIVSAQQPACLHGAQESPEQAARRKDALGLTRHINTVQTAEGSRTTFYQPLDRLPLVRGIPEAFAVYLATDGKGYAFSVKDKLDPCGFGYFSNQDGRIYVGEGLR